MHPLWLGLAKCLKTLILLAQILSYRDLSEAESQPCRRSGSKQRLMIAKAYFCFCSHEKKGNWTWKWRKGGQIYLLQLLHQPPEQCCCARSTVGQVGWALVQAVTSDKPCLPQMRMSWSHSLLRAAAQGLHNSSPLSCVCPRRLCCQCWNGG